MGHGRYLRQRGYTWYFRFRWPATLAACQLSGELQVSLRTTSYPVALHRARVLRLEMERLMEQITPAMAKARAEELARRWIDNCLWHLESNRATTDGYTYLNAAEIAEMGQEPARELEALADLGGRLFRNEHVQTIRRAVTGGPLSDALQKVVDSAGEEMDVFTDRATPAGRLASNLFLRAYATLLDEAGDVLAPVPLQTATAIGTPALPDFKFFAFWDEFVETKIAEGDWENDSAADARATRKLFLDLIGDLNFNKIDGEVAGRFRRKFLKLPWNYHTDKEWKEFAPSKIIEKIGRLNKEAKEKIRTTSPKTANKHGSHLSGYWDHLIKHGKIPKTAENPFPKHQTPRKRGRAARDEHPMWPTDLEIKLFSSPLYTGCKSIYRRTGAGSEIHRDALFWLPILGRTMGVRESEGCEPKVRDIRFIETEMGEIPYLHIEDSKTASSTRDEPFPKLVLDLGFLEYRYYGRDPDEPLFPELPPQGAEQRRSTSLGKKFVHYRKRVKIYDPLYDFRSFRGNFETWLRNLPDVNAGWIDELTGHESKIRRSEGARYTKSIFMMHLRRTIDRVTIGVDPNHPSKTPPIDFSHLTYNGPKDVQAPGAAKEIARYVALAEREMRKKVTRRRQP